MQGNDTAKGCGILVLIAAAYLLWCYVEVASKHRYALAVSQTMDGVSGARLVSSFKSGDLINPVSWFWPATTTLVYARADPSMPKRFFTMTFVESEEEQPTIILNQADCQARNYITYFPAQPGDTGEPARNVLGEPVVAPNGLMFLRHDTQIDPVPALVSAFCDTDWRRQGG